MLSQKLLYILSEGLIFSLFSYGVYLSFQWIKFPDLTPDGSFIMGGISYILAVDSGLHPIIGLVIGFGAGSLCGLITATLNRILKIPSVIAGLLTAFGLYSVGLLLLGKPNSFLSPAKTIVGELFGVEYTSVLLVYILSIVLVSTLLLSLYGNSWWGIRIRAIGENELLSKDLNASASLNTFIVLATANGLVALAGALFIQRSYSVDINMGTGQTIIGLIGMILGVLLSSPFNSIALTLFMIILATVLYKAIIFLTLELGMPAESFKLLSSAFLGLLFLVTRGLSIDLFKNLKWS